MNTSLLSKMCQKGGTPAEEGGVLFVCGTDTSVGKTFVCAHLLAYLCEKGANIGYQKWVSTGEGGRPADLEYCYHVGGKKPDPELVDLQVPYRFQFAASPHLAAAREERTIDSKKIFAAFNKMRVLHRFLIVEGVGGAMVPLTDDLLLIDLVASLAIPTLIVARSGLGTLNHTLLTLEALRSRSIPVVGVVFSDGEEDVNEVLVEDNLRTVASMGNTEVFGRLPFVRQGEGREAFKPIGDALVASKQMLHCFKD